MIHAPNCVLASLFLVGMDAETLQGHGGVQAVSLAHIRVSWAGLPRTSACAPPRLSCILGCGMPHEAAQAHTYIMYCMYLGCYAPRPAGLRGRCMGCLSGDGGVAPQVPIGSLLRHAPGGFSHGLLGSQHMHCFCLTWLPHELTESSIMHNQHVSHCRQRGGSIIHSSVSPRRCHIWA